MADKKLIAAIIKKLERAIGILDNCSETGEISEATHRRVIEMLNAATLDVYYIGNSQLDGVAEKALPNVQVAAEPSIEVEEFREQIKEIVLAPNVHGEPQFSAMHEIVEEIEHAADAPFPSNELDEEQLALEVVAAFNAPVEFGSEQEEQLEQASSSFIPELADELIDEETTTIPTQNVDEREQLEDEAAPPITISSSSSETSFSNPPTLAYQEPLLELELSPINIADFEAETDYNIEEKVASSHPMREVPPLSEDPSIALERQQLESLRLQLELERTRLETELQSWQTERMKRDEEMRAAEKLLAALQAEELRRRSAAIVPPAVPVPPVITNAPPVAAERTNVNAVAKPPLADKLDNSSKEQMGEKEQVAIIDKFLNNRKSLHDTFEHEDLRTQGITPISDLTKAIGINDKFQFIKELFGGDSDFYVDTINTLNNGKSLEEVISFVETHFEWDKNSDSVKRLILLLRRRYMA